jgi:putative phage-type endonuclease
MSGPVYHRDVEQGSERWHQLRTGILTASTMARIMTPTGKTAANDKSRAHEWELLAQRISNYVEPQYIGDAMVRGQEEEIYARIIYAEKHAAVEQVGFITLDMGGFIVGYSPDGIVGDDGLIECKSRAQRFQVETIVVDEMPAEYAVQVQTGLLVTGRSWCDFCSYSNGLPMMVKRIDRDEEMIANIAEAAATFEARLNERMATYTDKLSKRGGLHPTKRLEREMVI